MITRQTNWLGQQRVDAPHLRAMESSVAADFDLLGGSIMAGAQALVVRGFDIITSGAIGNPATALQLNVANGIVMHPMASEHGTMFSVPSDTAVEVLSGTNPNVSGSFTAGQVNYVGLDLIRGSDDSTADLVMFLDANSLTSTPAETPKSVPLARTLKYKIIVSTTDFASTSNVLPLAKITTDNTNTVTAVEDARGMMYRLGSGGSVPDRLHAYPWPAGRAETTSGAVFSGGDKGISSLKDWMDAAMTRLWELGGGEHWYSPTADRNVTMVWSGSPFGNGENFLWDGTNLTWKGLKFIFANSTVTYNTVSDQITSSPGLTNLADGECIYVDLDRSTNATLAALKSPLTTLGTPTVPGSRQVIAWRLGTQIFTRNNRTPVGAIVPVATTTSNGLVTLSKAPTDPNNPVVLTDTEKGAANGVASLDGSQAVVGTGLTRGSLTAGTLTIGAGANDTAVAISKATTISALTTITAAQNSASVLTATNTGTLSAGITGKGTASGGSFAGTGSTFVIDRTGTNGIVGVIGKGGSAGGDGVVGIAGGTNRSGVYGEGSGTGQGVSGRGADDGTFGGTPGIGVLGQGGSADDGHGGVSPGASGGKFIGGLGADGSTGIGGDGFGGSANLAAGNGHYGKGGRNDTADSRNAGHGVYGEGGDGGGIGVVAKGSVDGGTGVGTGAAFRLVPQATPTATVGATDFNGCMWYDQGTNTIKVIINGVTKTFTVT